jgi:hypothetical protein
MIRLIVLAFGLTAYATAVYQMRVGTYSPSFFSRGVWFLLGIISFAGVALGEGSPEAVALAGALFVGNSFVFAFSYKYGSREFGFVEKISLGLLGASVLSWLIFDSPFLGLAISLIAHFIGGLPTLWRVLKDPHSEQAYHWYFFFTGCVISLIVSENRAIEVILFPLYFALFDGLVILLANRRHFIRSRNGVEKSA